MNNIISTNSSSTGIVFCPICNEEIPYSAIDILTTINCNKNLQDHELSIKIVKRFTNTYEISIKSILLIENNNVYTITYNNYTDSFYCVITSSLINPTKYNTISIGNDIPFSKIKLINKINMVKNFG